MRSSRRSWKSKRSSSSPSASRDCIAVRRKFAIDTPGISTGYWNARKRPARARSCGSISSRERPSKVTVPAVAWYPGCPVSTFASVLLPEALGPMIAWTSPSGSSRSTPLRIPSSVSVTLA